MKKILLIFFFILLNVKEAFSEIKEIFCVSENSVRYVDGVKQEIQKINREVQITKETGTTKWCINVGWSGLGESRCSYFNNQDILSFNWHIPFVNFDLTRSPYTNEEDKLKNRENYERWLKKRIKEFYIIDVRNKKFRYEMSSVNIYPEVYKGKIFHSVADGSCEIK